ncbi:MAG TPA: T9SS type A sorting domain-containing protein [Bacteroidales bacterium]|nr:T9SS type A sorting domain-containing protein [Bacteroidales bacterium]
MKTQLILLIIFGMCANFVTAQQDFGFSYDNAGNRTQRYLLLMFKNADADTASVYFKDELNNENDISGLFELNVYPNPADDLINITLTEGELKNTMQVEMYDNTGRILVSDTFNGNLLTIPVKNYPAGNYIMKIWNNKEQFDFQIIKKY